MRFDLEHTVHILGRTPSVLDVLLRNLARGWTLENEGPETWSPYDVLGHLVHGDREDWIPRMETILNHGPARTFTPFDRFAQFESSRGKTLEDLLDDFGLLRAGNVDRLKEMNLSPMDLEQKGRHPDFGEVTLRELLATWVVHDLGHIRQICRVMAKQYRGEVGPWVKYLPVLTSG